MDLLFSQRIYYHILLQIQISAKLRQKVRKEIKAASFPSCLVEQNIINAFLTIRMTNHGAQQELTNMAIMYKEKTNMELVRNHVQ